MSWNWPIVCLNIRSYGTSLQNEFRNYVTGCWRNSPVIRRMQSEKSATANFRCRCALRRGVFVSVRFGHIQCLQFDVHSILQKFNVQLFTGCGYRIEFNLVVFDRFTWQYNGLFSSIRDQISVVYWYMVEVDRLHHFELPILAERISFKHESLKAKLSVVC